jgi:cell division septum initiation protein DivIVA
MSVELHADGEAAQPPSALQVVRGVEPEDRERPNVSGDLPTVLEVAPMFRRAVVGYDRFQVDTYVQWAEDELSTADRERRHLEARHLRTQAALEEAQLLLSHSSGGGEFLQLSRRMGSMLAVAADEAESMHAAAEADRAAAAAEAERTVADAERRLADARAEAQRMVAEATTEAEQVMARAHHLVDEAERALEAAQAEVAMRLAEVQATELRAAENADVVRLLAAEDATAARLHARAEIVAMLSTAREERRRADAAAAATRERLDRDAAARYVSLVAEIEALEHRRAALRSEIELLTTPVPGPQRERLDVHLRRLLDRFHLRPRSLRAP